MELQSNMFPDIALEPPEQVERTWAVADRWWDRSDSRAPREEDFAEALNINVRTFQRWKKRWPHLIPRQFTRNLPRPWLLHPELLYPEHTPVEAIVESVVIDHRQLRLLYIDSLGREIQPILANGHPAQLVVDAITGVVRAI